MAAAKGVFFSGTSGLVVPLRQSLYPPAFLGKSRLVYYASLLNSIEINSSFYKLPQAATVAKWTEAVPDHFRFSFKLSKSITHAKGLRFNTEDVRLFMESIAPANDKRGCVLIQLPPKITIEDLNGVQQLLYSMKEPGTGWKLAIEFRHSSWYTHTVYQMLQAYDACMVVHDLPASATPILNSQSKVVYHRFHGLDGRYRGSYSNEILNKQADIIKAAIDEGREVYAYFNNTMGNAFDNVQTLTSLIQSPPENIFT